MCSGACLPHITGAAVSLLPLSFFVVLPAAHLEALGNNERQAEREERRDDTITSLITFPRLSEMREGGAPETSQTNSSPGRQKLSFAWRYGLASLLLCCFAFFFANIFKERARSEQTRRARSEATQKRTPEHRAAGGGAAAVLLFAFLKKTTSTVVKKRAKAQKLERAGKPLGRKKAKSKGVKKDE